MTTPKLKIIAVSGSSGSGMTTLCDSLGRILGIREIKTAYISCFFAAHAVLETGFGLDMPSVIRNDQRFAGSPEERGDHSGARASWHEVVIDLDMGMRIGRSQEFVSRMLLSRITDFKKQGTQVVIVDDLRFPEDKKLLKRLGAKFVRLPKRIAGLDDKFAHVMLFQDMCDTSLDDDDEWDVKLKGQKAPEAEAAQVLEKLNSYITS